ncbi:MAG: hypothetical protein ACRDTS_16190 [Mycobacterium sp.]
MTRIAELSDVPVTAPAVSASTPKPWGVGVDAQVGMRSQAEQLVCEANAVLAGTGQRITLDDEVGTEALAFTLRFDDRVARIATRRVGEAAQARFDGWGSRCSEAVELADIGALEDVIALLVAGKPTGVGVSA